MEPAIENLQRAIELDPEGRESILSLALVSPRSQILSGNALKVAMPLAAGRPSLRRRIPGKAVERELSVNQGNWLVITVIVKFF